MYLSHSNNTDDLTCEWFYRLAYYCYGATLRRSFCRQRRLYTKTPLSTARLGLWAPATSTPFDDQIVTSSVLYSERRCRRCMTQLEMRSIKKHPAIFIPSQKYRVSGILRTAVFRQVISCRQMQE